MSVDTYHTVPHQTPYLKYCITVIEHLKKKWSCKHCFRVMCCMCNELAGDYVAQVLSVSLNSRLMLLAVSQAPDIVASCKLDKNLDKRKKVM